jgi:uncharacterized membrane protein
MSKKDSNSHKASWIVLLVAASCALVAAFVLSLEKIHLMSNPDAVLSCTFNLVLNCSTVMETWQASVFWGIPNMYIGLMAFPVIITVAVAALWGKAQFSRGFIVAMNAGVFLGTIFSYWLFFSSLYVIEVLCPWCLIVTTACTFMLAASTHITLKENYLRFAKKTNTAVQAFLKKGYHQLAVASWIVLMLVLVFLKFGTDLFA